MSRRPYSPNRRVLNTILHHLRQQGGALPSRPALQPAAPTEKYRTYHYPGGKRLLIHRVTKISAEPFEHVWLETAYGESVLIPPGWTHCDVMSEDEYEIHNGIL